MKMKSLKSDIAIFLYKAVGIYLLWYCIYDLWLLPAGWLDAWVTTNIAQIGYDILNLIGYQALIEGRHVGIAGTVGILLVDGCSGISQTGLFVGFVVAYPGRWTPRILFIMIGIGIIYVTNIIRIVALAIILKEWPHIFDFTHTFSTTAIFYIIIFGLWMIWVNYGDQKFTSSPDSEQPAIAS